MCLGGGSVVDFHFLLFLIEEKCQLPGTFLGMKNILFLIKVIACLNLKITYNYIAHVNFNRDFPKISFKISNFERCLYAKIDQKCRFGMFKIRYLHSWGLNQKSAGSKVLFWSLEPNYQVSCQYLKTCKRR